jgi:hypothetical protein
MTGREFSEADTRKGLECCCVQRDCKDCPYNKGVFEGCMSYLLSDAYDIIKMNDSTPLPINWADTVPHGTCPSCGAIVMQYIDSPKPNYCFNCGLKLIIEGAQNKN